MSAALAARPNTAAAAAWRHGLRLPAALLAALLVKVGLLLAGAVPFNGDEAIVALMARHILWGERPTFFYGQAYMGSLDAYLIAGLFAVAGPSVWAVRAVQIAVYLGTVATTYWLGRRIYRSEWVAGAAAVFLAIPPVLTTLYTTVTLGSYGEVLLIGNLLLLLALALGEAARRPADPARARRMAAGGLALGFLGGLGFWCLSLIGVYLLPIAVYLAAVLWNRKARLAGLGLAAMAGFALGASPWLAYTARFGLATVADSVGTSMPVPANYQPVLAVFRHLFYFLLFGVTVVWGLRPPWSAEFLALPLLPFALALQAGIFIFTVRGLRRTQAPEAPGRALLLGMMATLIGAYLLTPYGEDPSGRYFVPLTIPTALFAAATLHWLRLRRRRRSPWRKWFAQTLALGLVAFYWLTTVQAAVRNPPGLTTQFSEVVQIDTRALPRLIAFLREHGETRGYANYWVSYPLAFESGEELVFAPLLPYHPDFRYTPRDNRYPAYAEQAEASLRAAYITTKHPALDAHLREAFAALGVDFRETAIGDYHVFYGLSRKVQPAELGLGSECCAP
jgi:4-amino-4-deoxy-L-arabinose transferase-like glycosyltransferase